MPSSAGDFQRVVIDVGSGPAATTPRRSLFPSNVSQPVAVGVAAGSVVAVSGCDGVGAAVSDDGIDGVVLAAAADVSGAPDAGVSVDADVSADVSDVIVAAVVDDWEVAAAGNVVDDERDPVPALAQPATIMEIAASITFTRIRTPTPGPDDPST